MTEWDAGGYREQSSLQKWLFVFYQMEVQLRRP